MEKLYKISENGTQEFTPEEYSAHAAMLQELAVAEYRDKRALAYPPIGDQLDALWKGGEAAAAMLAQVQAVKAKYPKPE